MKGSTGEVIVGDRNGVWKTRTIKRKPEEERWKMENLEMVGGVPWRVSETDENVDGERMMMTRPTETAKEKDDVEKDWKDDVPRRFDISEKDLENTVT